MSVSRLVAAGAVVVTGIMSAACAHTVSGAAHTASSAAPSSTPGSSSAPPRSPAVTAADLAHILLTPAAFAAVTGTSDMSPTSEDFTTAGGWSGYIDDPTCGPVAGSGDAALYANSGYVGIRGNRFVTPSSAAPEHAADVTQAAAFFLSSSDAAAFLQRIRTVWQGCANRRFAVEFSDGVHGHLDVGDVVVGADRVVINFRQQEDPSWRCSHVMAVRNTVEVDARVCVRAKDPAVAADDAVNQMLAAVPR